MPAKYLDANNSWGCVFDPLEYEKALLWEAKQYMADLNSEYLSQSHLSCCFNSVFLLIIQVQ